MKANILGLLKFAQDHLALLDEVVNLEIDITDLPDRMKVNSASEILSELIENIAIVQSDPTQLEDFLKIYCLKK